MKLESVVVRGHDNGSGRANRVCPLGCASGSRVIRAHVGVHVHLVGVEALPAVPRCHEPIKGLAIDGVRPRQDHSRHFRSRRSSNWYESPVSKVTVRGGVRAKPTKRPNNDWNVCRVVVARPSC